MPRVWKAIVCIAREGGYEAPTATRALTWSQARRLVMGYLQQGINARLEELEPPPPRKRGRAPAIVSSRQLQLFQRGDK